MLHVANVFSENLPDESLSLRAGKPFFCAILNQHLRISHSALQSW